MVKLYFFGPVNQLMKRRDEFKEMLDKLKSENGNTESTEWVIKNLTVSIDFLNDKRIENMDKIVLVGPIGCLANKKRELEGERDYQNFESDKYKVLGTVIQKYVTAINILKEANRR